MKRVTPKQAFAAREAHQASLELQRLLDEAAKTTHAAELESFHAAKRGEDTAVRRTLRRSAGAGAGKIGDCGSCLVRSSCRESEAHFLAGVTRTERRSQFPVAPPDAIIPFPCASAWERPAFSLATRHLLTLSASCAGPLLLGDLWHSVTPGSRNAKGNKGTSMAPGTCRRCTWPAGASSPRRWPTSPSVKSSSPSLCAAKSPAAVPSSPPTSTIAIS